MITNIEIHSRSSMENLSHNLTGSKNCAIVSISDANQIPPTFANNPAIIDIYTCFFDDEEDGPTSMTLNTATEILSFVKEMDQQNIETLYIHCGAGVSRSAGTAAAIMMLWWGDDSQVFNNGFYSPNMHCYRTMLTAAGFGYTDDELLQKEACQYELWKIMHADDLDI